MEWISVEYELPDIKQDVLVYMQAREFSTSLSIVTTTFTKYGFERACVTHWMPLPKPPLSN